MDVEIAFSPEGLSARLFIINIRFYESELNPKSLSMLISKCFDHYFQFMLRFYIQG